MALSINPNTIQRAYAELERQGYIYSIKGKGSFVTDTSKMKQFRQKGAREKVLEAASEAARLGLGQDEIIEAAREGIRQSEYAEAENPAGKSETCLLYTSYGSKRGAFVLRKQSSGRYDHCQRKGID